MPKFKHKPVVIEAFKWLHDEEHAIFPNKAEVKRLIEDALKRCRGEL